MKTLRAFWHWIDNDKPSEIRRDKLSKVALTALLHAESEVGARAFGVGSSSMEWWRIWDLCSAGDGTNPNERPEFYRPELVKAVRDLSLAICPALEAMHAAVPEGKVITSPWLKPHGEYEMQPFRREYLGEWIPAAAPGRDTFFGVDRGDRKDVPLSGVRVPQSFRLGRLQAPVRYGVPLEPQAEPTPDQQLAYQEAMNRQALYDYGAYLGDAMVASTQLDCHPPKDPPPPPPNVYEYVTNLVVHLSPTMTLRDCDALRGARPCHIRLVGNPRNVPQIVWDYLRDDVLAPMIADGAELVTE